MRPFSRTLSPVLENHERQTEETQEDSQVVSPVELAVEEEQRDHDDCRNAHGITEHDAQDGRVRIGLHHQEVRLRIDDRNNHVFPPGSLR